MSLYHYTNLPAAFSILSNKKLWLTDIRYLNDKEELSDGIEFIASALVEPRQDVFTNASNDIKAEEYLYKYLWEMKSYGVSEDPIFLFSLSSEKDCLSQWRAYGSYAIEFDTNLIKETISNLFKCTYVDKEKQEKARLHAQSAISTVSKSLVKNEGKHSNEALNAALSLIYDAATFKHDGFSEEKESRIIRLSDDSEYPNNIKYRPRGDVLIPYIEVPISLDCIKSITIGPIQNQEMAYYSMSEFVDTIVKNWQVDSGNIEYELIVNKSAIPYRA